MINKKFKHYYLDYDSQVEGEENDSEDNFDYSYSYSTSYNFNKVYLTNNNKSNAGHLDLMSPNEISLEEKFYIPAFTTSTGDSFGSHDAAVLYTSLMFTNKDLAEIVIDWIKILGHYDRNNDLSKILDKRKKLFKLDKDLFFILDDNFNFSYAGFKGSDFGYFENLDNLFLLEGKLNHSLSTHNIQHYKSSMTPADLLEKEQIIYQKQLLNSKITDNSLKTPIKNFKI